MFDTIAGLPLHPLIVHGAVIGLPVAALVTVLVAVRPAWRRHTVPVLALNAVVMVMTWVAMQSGESLQRRVTQFSTPDGLSDHALWGGRLFLLSVVLFLGSVVLHLVRARSMFASIVALALVLIGIATIGLTALVGHSGASMVWKSIVDSTTG